MSMTEAPSRRRLLTIGTVCGLLQDEFPDVSISKIRYLEDQGLVTPRRTQAGYRLFSDDDVERLQTILRLQRDEFLPLRVIREELAAGAGKERRKRRSGVGAGEEELDLDDLCERAGITADRARELEDFGLLEPRVEEGQRIYAESDVDIAAACEALARSGIDARNLRAFRTAADRESGLHSTTSSGWRRAPASSPTCCFAATSAAWSSSLAPVAALDLKTRVREVPNFPEPGVGFKDISPLLLDPEALRQAVGELAGWTREREADLVLGAEARGFWLGAAIAAKVGCGFVAARRPGKLPPATVSATYALEYGENTLEVAADAIGRGARVVVEHLGGTVVGVNFVIELSFLNGRERLDKYDLFSLITY